MATNKLEVSEGLYEDDVWDRLDIHIGSYVKSPIQLRYVSTKTGLIGRALRNGVVDLLNNILNNQTGYVENETSVLGTENRLSHSRTYKLKVHEGNKPDGDDHPNDDEEMECQITSIAPTVFSQLREDIGISNENFRQSFAEQPLKDFTNPGKSGSLMYKTSDDLFILKTLREYEARLLIQILSGYHLHLTQHQTMFNRYIGLYSIRCQVAISTTEIFIVVMANAFTPALQINEIFDLKGSKIKRKSLGYFSAEKLHKLKDMDFMDLYPHGIRIPTNIYHKLKLIVANDAKKLRKLNITDFSLILGIRHLDLTESELIQRRPTTGVAALCSMNHGLKFLQLMGTSSEMPSPMFDKSTTSSFVIPYLKPLDMVHEPLDHNLFYHDDMIAHASLPIPGIINQTNQRVYLYMVFVDMLQTFDRIKVLDNTFRKLTDYNRRLEYSVIEPDEYEKRINNFLFEHVFIDAKEDFSWPVSPSHQPVVENGNADVIKKKHRRRTHHHSEPVEDEQSDSILEFRL